MMTVRRQVGDEAVKRPPPKCNRMVTEEEGESKRLSFSNPE
jgi:hypothetical protein